MRSTSVASIYFQKDAIAPSSTNGPELAESRSVPIPVMEVKSTTEQETKTEAKDTDDTSAEVEEATNWQMDSMPSTFTVMNHQVSIAQPVFTPQPRIEYRDFQELARGRDFIFEVVIDNQGHIAQVEVLQGAVGDGVEDLIVETLRRWVFVPAKFDGVGVTSRRQLQFHFPG